MAQKNGTYKVYNGSSFDEIMFKTSEEQVSIKESTKYDLNLNSGYYNIDAPNYKCTYLKKQGICMLTMYLGGCNTQGYHNIATLPVGFRPSNYVIGLMNTGDYVALVEVAPNGNISVYEPMASQPSVRGSMTFYAGGGTV